MHRLQLGAVSLEDTYMKQIPHLNASATTDGQIFSHRLNRFVAQYNDKDGYKLCKVDGKMYRVHRLVARAYHGESDLVIDHLNNIKYDNRPENLEYVTVQENTNRAYLEGLLTPPQHENEKRKKFSNDDILFIRKHFGVDENYNTLGSKYNVSRGVIWQIVNYKTYKEVS